MSSSSPDAVVIDAAFQAESFEVFEVTVPSAHVTLRPHDDPDEVHIRGFVPDTAPETAGALFDRKGISTQQSGSQLHLFGASFSDSVEDWRWRRDHRTAVHFDVHLPPSLDVNAEIPGGAIDAANLDGALSCSVMGGPAHLDRLTGPVQVHGGGGALRVEEFEGSSLNLRWSAGSVHLLAIAGDTTTLHAASAATTVEGLHGPADLSVQGASLILRRVEGPCEAQVHGGSLTYYGAPSNATTLQTIGGPLHTHLPPAHAATLTLTGTQVALDEAFAFSGERTARRIEGRLNGGGPSLQARAVQGMVQCSAEAR